MVGLELGLRLGLEVKLGYVVYNEFHQESFVAFATLSSTPQGFSLAHVGHGRGKGVGSCVLGGDGTMSFNTSRLSFRGGWRCTTSDLVDVGGRSKLPHEVEV